MGGSSVSLIV